MAKGKRQVLSSRYANPTGLTYVLPRGKPSGNVGSPLVAICIATPGKSAYDSERLEQSDALAINLSEAHCPFVYPPSSILNHLPSVALNPEQSPLQEAMKVVTGPL